MKKITDITFCTCENQFLLSPGCTCDICMGTVPESGKYRTDLGRQISFGPDYFEALEQMQTDPSGFDPDIAA